MAQNRRSNREEYKQYYSQGSAARQVATQPATRPQRNNPAAKPRPRQNPRRNPNHAHNPQKRYVYRQVVEYDFDVQVKHSHSLLSYIILIAAVAGLIGWLSLNARLDYNQSRIQGLNAELASVNAANDARRGEANANLNMQEIQQIATEMGMVFPSHSQYMDINVVPQSYFSHANLPPQTGQPFSISQFLSGVFRALFSGQ